MCSRVRYWSSVCCECLSSIPIENGCNNKENAGIHTINVNVVVNG